MSTPTPRDLDPKFEKTDPPTEENAPEETEPMLVHRVNFLDEDGVQHQKEHRVPVKDWPAYAEKHGF